MAKTILRTVFHKLFIVFFLAAGLKSAGQCNMFVIFSSGVYNCQTGQALGEYTINGGVTPHSFTVVNSISNATLWSGTVFSNTGTFTTVPVGTYNVYGITSIPGCTFSSFFSVNSPISPANVSFTTSPSCFGASTGTASAFINGPLQPPFSYSWSANGGSAATATNLPAGVITLTVQDNNGCKVTNTVSMTETPQIHSAFASTFISCFSGTLPLTPITTTGGTSPYTYTVNNNPSGSSVSGLTAGIHTIITKDDKACVKVNTIQVSQPPPATIGFSVSKPFCPSSSDGSVVASVTNAPLAYTYTWAPGGSNSATLANIPVGNYTLTVKDGSSCITTSVVAVTPVSSINSSISTKPENCSAMDGAFTINVSGGAAPYTFSTLGVGAHTSNVLSGLSSGAYTVVVYDGNNCRDTLKFGVGNLSTVSVSIVNSAAPKCYGQCTGSVQLNVQNAVPPLTYSASGTPTTASNIISGLCAGLITIKVVDGNGCPAATSVSFTPPPVFSYSAANPAPVCVGKTTTLQAAAAGGAGGYSFVWNPGGLNGQSVTVAASVSTVYSLNVYDANNCTLPPFTVTVTVNPPISIHINPSGAGICPGTTAQISPTVSGGDGIYSYNWMPGNFTGPSIFVESIIVPYYTLTVNDICGSPPAIKVVTINLFPVTVPTFTVSKNSGCQPLCTQFMNTTPKSTNVVWNFGDKPNEQAGDVSNYCYQKAGKFSVRLSVTDSNSCRSVYTYSNAVSVLKKPTADFHSVPSVITLPEADNVFIENVSINASNFFWFVAGQAYASTRTIGYSFADTGCVNFKLVALSNEGCRDTIEKALCVVDGFSFWMPNAFTPDGNGLNDEVRPQGSAWSAERYSFEVFNRWGARIFYTHDIHAGWDGKVKGETATDDQYYYEARVRDQRGREHHFRGFITLLR